MKAEDAYYASGMWGQQTTQGRTVLEELTARNVAASLANPEYRLSPDKDIVSLAIATAKETIKQLDNEP